ncbi:Glycosyltransferase involved in cell wall bisynthesis [Ligilactobacillus sp. WC1T17]|uniref:Glycosyltransferase involved in cell wall bisynthesis n=1 Tax=Ligilactobacillus ruminis TaxID=1623 RepID=A0ABY1A8X2_9LACO|nr:Glycosyltransferase involved in cell wall bisynthesis [Ligilactobacillus ruminis]
MTDRLIIVVNDVAAAPNAGGVFSILEDFYKDVVKSDTKNQWFFLLSGRYFEETENVKIIVKNDLKKSRVKKFLYESLYGKNEINKLNPDVYISLQNISTIGVKAKKKITYVHTPVPFQRMKNYSPFKSGERSLWMYQDVVGGLIKKSLKKERPTIIVQTQWMKEELLKRNIALEKDVIVSWPMVPKTNGEKFEGEGTEFFYPTSQYQYKNYQLIYDAVNILHNEGINNFNVELTLPENSNEKLQGITFIGHIKREEVYKKYTKKILIFPSYMETFGLPLIEAAIRGDIIYAADTPFGHELLDGYNNVYYFKYNDASTLADLMRSSINGKIVSDGTVKKQSDSSSVYKLIMNLI